MDKSGRAVKQGGLPPPLTIEVHIEPDKMLGLTNLQDVLNTIEATKKLEKIKGVSVTLAEKHGSVFYLKCTDLNGLGKLWFMYRNGELGKLLHSCLNVPYRQLSSRFSVEATVDVGKFRKALDYLLAKPGPKGLCRTTSVDNLMAPLPPAIQVGHSKLNGLDLAMVGREDQISTLKVTVGQVQTALLATREKSQQQISKVKEDSEAREKSLRETITRMTERNAEKEQKIFEYREEIQQLHDTNKTREAKIEELTAQNTNLSDQLTLTDIPELREEVRGLREKSETSEKLLLEKNLEIQLLQDQLTSTQKDIPELREEVMKLREKSETSDKLLCEKNLEIQQLEGQLTSTQRDIPELREEVMKLREKGETSNKLLREKNLEIQQLEDQLTSTQRDIPELREEVMKLREKGETSKALLLNKNAQIQQLQDTNETKEAKIEQLTDQNTDLSNQLSNTDILKLRKEVRTLKDSDDASHKALEEKNVEIQQLYDTIRTKEAKIDRLEAQNKRLSNQLIGISHLRDEVRTLREKDETSQKLLSVQALDIKHLRQANTGIAAKVDDLLSAKHTVREQHQKEDTGKQERRSTKPEKKMDASTRSKQIEETPLHKAAERGHVGVAKQLLKAGAQVDSRDKFERTPLHKAASGGHVGVADVLIKAGAQVDSRDKDGDRPLHYVASGGHLGLAKHLLKAGAQLDSRNKIEETPLHKAAERGIDGVAKQLLKAGAQVDSRDKSGYSPLHKAASGGHVSVAEVLIKAGAQVDSRDKVGCIPLHCAALGGHVASAKHLLKAGAQMGRKDKDGQTPKDIAARKDVSPQCSSAETERILEGRKKILDLFAAVKVVRHKVGPEGGELQTTSCTISVPPGAVTMETEFTCQVINPNDAILTLKDGEMLVSDIIELGPHQATFHKPVTVQMQYSSTPPGGTRETVFWVTENMLQWMELQPTEKTEDNLTVPVFHFSTFAVVSRFKQDQFWVSSEACTLTSSTQPAVHITFPEQSVQTQTQVNIQVQEVPKSAVDDMRANDESSRGLISTSPIVLADTVSDSTVQFNKPVTVRVPHPHHYMDIKNRDSTKLRVMSCEKREETWTDMTDATKIRVTEQFVEFEVCHFTRYVVIVVVDIYDDPEELGPIPLNLCRWLQCRVVQFILLQREDNENEFVIECTLAEHAEKRCMMLKQEGYTGPLPTDNVDLFEGQMVEIRLHGDVSFVGSRVTRHITFHSQKRNRLQTHVIAVRGKDKKGLEGKGVVMFLSVLRVEVSVEERTKALQVTESTGPEDLQQPSHEGHQEPKLLCELPICVPYETPEVVSLQEELNAKPHFIEIIRAHS
ncbi:uncharacterized protein [Branchiostoma lanceolatum]|uniref:uncharacterized protein isoform X2 n=1 Tax=Branchiostoma lanceolatum TaxID=7740 RepID=UPI00345169A7